MVAYNLTDSSGVSERIAQVRIEEIYAANLSLYLLFGWTPNSCGPSNKSQKTNNNSRDPPPRHALVKTPLCQDDVPGERCSGQTARRDRHEVRCGVAGQRFPMDQEGHWGLGVGRDDIGVT